MSTFEQRQADLAGEPVIVASWEEWWASLQPAIKAGIDPAAFAAPAQSIHWGERPAEMSPPFKRSR